MRRSLLVPAAAVLAFTVAGAGPASAQSTFGRAPVTVDDPNTAPEGQPELIGVTVGHHPAYDRVVFRFSSRAPGYSVRYVPEVTEDPSGHAVRLAGDAFIAVSMHSVASAQVGKPAAPQGRQQPRFPALREVAGAGDFEGHVSFGLGLSARSGFRAFTLRNPDRLVVDVRIPAAQPGPSATATGPAATPAGAANDAAPRVADTGSRTGPVVLGAVALLMLGTATRWAIRRRHSAGPARP